MILANIVRSTRTSCFDIPNQISTVLSAITVLRVEFVNNKKINVIWKRQKKIQFFKLTHNQSRGINRHILMRRVHLRLHFRSWIVRQFWAEVETHTNPLSMRCRLNFALFDVLALVCIRLPMLAAATARWEVFSATHQMWDLMSQGQMVQTFNRQLIHWFFSAWLMHCHFIFLRYWTRPMSNTFERIMDNINNDINGLKLRPNNNQSE